MIAIIAGKGFLNLLIGGSFGGSVASKSSPPPLTLDELREIISDHRLCLRSAGKEGPKANLTGANLEGLDLDGYDLSDLDFRGANLARVKFGDALVEGTNFQEADLRKANLSGARHLLGPQLAGADLSGANLPEDVEKFESLPHVNAAIKHAQTTFFALLLVCVFCWLAIAITTDAGLITNSIETELPVIRTKMNIAAFYIAAPLLLFCLYIYLQLRKQRLWEALSELPAVFPDGRPLPYHLHPWLGSGLLWIFLPRLCNHGKRPNLIWVENHLFMLLSGWLAPLTLLALWWRSLPAHNWLLNGFQIALLSPALAAAHTLPMYTRSTLRLRASWSEIRGFAWGASIIVVTGAVAVIFSYYAFTGWFAEQYEIANKQPNPNKLKILEIKILNTLNNSTCANLEEVEVSTKPINWSGKPEEVKGANLRGMDLRHAKASQAFLVRADLRGAQLQGATLDFAQLQKAVLSGASLKGANLSSSHLEGADLKYAWMQGAILEFAHLEGADLSGTKMEKVNLQNAKLMGADLNRTELHGADLSGAELHGAKFNLTEFQEAKLGKAYFDNKVNLSGAIIMKAADLTEAKLEEAFLQYADLEDAILVRAHLSLANLDQANLVGADLTQANLKKASLNMAKLQEAKLKGADLQYARMSHTELAGANLTDANLNGVDFRWARGLSREQVISARNRPLALFSLNLLQELNLPEDHENRLRRKDLKGYSMVGVHWYFCNLAGFNLKKVDMRQTHFLGCDLQGAQLQDADMSGADLSYTNLKGANLKRANLKGADLHSAKGLTRKQLQSAIGDETTQIPDQLKDMGPNRP